MNNDVEQLVGASFAIRDQKVIESNRWGYLFPTFCEFVYVYCWGLDVCVSPKFPWEIPDLMQDGISRWRFSMVLMVMRVDSALLKIMKIFLYRFPKRFLAFVCACSELSRQLRTPVDFSLLGSQRDFKQEDWSAHISSSRGSSNPKIKPTSSASALNWQGDSLSLTTWAVCIIFTLKSMVIGVLWISFFFFF